MERYLCAPCVRPLRLAISRRAIQQRFCRCCRLRDLAESTHGVFLEHCRGRDPAAARRGGGAPPRQQRRLVLCGARCTRPAAALHRTVVLRRTSVFRCEYLYRRRPACRSATGGDRARPTRRWWRSSWGARRRSSARSSSSAQVRPSARQAGRQPGSRGRGAHYLSQCTRGCARACQTQDGGAFPPRC